MKSGVFPWENNHNSHRNLVQKKIPPPRRKVHEPTFLWFAGTTPAWAKLWGTQGGPGSVRFGSVTVPAQDSSTVRGFGSKSSLGQRFSLCFYTVQQRGTVLVPVSVPEKRFRRFRFGPCATLSTVGTPKRTKILGSAFGMTDFRRLFSSHRIFFADSIAGFFSLIL